MREQVFRGSSSPFNFAQQIEEEEEDFFNEEEESDDLDLPTPPAEEEEEEEEDLEEEDQEEEEEEVELTPTMMYYKALKEKGSLKKEFEGDFKAEDLMTAMEDEAKSRAEEEIQAKYAHYTPEVLEYAEYLAKGGDPERITATAVYDQLISLPTEGESDNALAARKFLIEEMYKATGLNPRRVTDLYESLLANGEDIEEAEAAKEFFKSKRDERVESIKAELSKASEQEAERLKEETRQIAGLVKTGKIQDFAIPEEEQSSLVDYMTKPTKIIETRDALGNKVKKQVTQYFYDLIQADQSVETQILIAMALKNKFTMPGAAQKETVKKRGYADSLDKPLKRKPNRDRSNPVWRGSL